MKTTALRGTAVTAASGSVGCRGRVCFVTGLISHFIQHPQPWSLAHPAGVAIRVTQGLHVISGIAAIR